MIVVTGNTYFICIDVVLKLIKYVNIFLLQCFKIFVLLVDFSSVLTYYRSSSVQCVSFYVCDRLQSYTCIFQLEQLMISPDTMTIPIVIYWKDI